MGLNLKNVEVERLAMEVARMTGETKTEAIRQALLERHRRLTYRVGKSDRGLRFERYLEQEVWPLAPPGQLGRRLTRKEEDEILGYSEDGI